MRGDTESCRLSTSRASFTRGVNVILPHVLAGFRALELLRIEPPALVLDAAPGPGTRLGLTLLGLKPFTTESFLFLTRLRLWVSCGVT